MVALVTPPLRFTLTRQRVGDGSILSPSDNSDSKGCCQSSWVWAYFDETFEMTNDEETVKCV